MPLHVALLLSLTLTAGAYARHDAELAAELGADDYSMHRDVMAFLKAGPNRDRSEEAAATLQREHLDNIRASPRKAH